MEGDEQKQRFILFGVATYTFLKVEVAISALK